MENALGAYLRDRRSKLDPAALGYPAGRRRTGGLRREEVAQRANISPTWYTCLEQGRGGAPSPDVVDRLSNALMLTEVEREHLFMLGLGRPPEARYQGDNGVTPRLQHILDALDPSPALIRTATWDVLAWNRAVTVMFGDYGALPADQRNVLRIIFLDPRVRAQQDDWAGMARLVVGMFRVEAARAGAAEEVGRLVDELCRLSPEFAAMWRENDVRGPYGETIKHMRHPILGTLGFEYSVLSIDARSDLSLVIYNPASSADAQKIVSLMEAPTSGPSK